MPITVPELPYPRDALEPHMSERTMNFHYEKHHKIYAKKLNGLIEGTELADLSLEDIIFRAARNPKLTPVFNNGAQVWNHTFFWEGMAPDTSTPSGKLASMLDEHLGGLDGFKKEFAKAGEGRFGSGYAWLVIEGGKLKVTSTQNADNPMVHGSVPLLCCDVWEHAYYLDYHQERARFLRAFVDNLIHWDRVAQRLDEAPKAMRHVA